MHLDPALGIGCIGQPVKTRAATARCEQTSMPGCCCSLQVGVFSMTERGLDAVANPSALFLSDRAAAPGVSSAVTVTCEGTRPLLLEVQALCSPMGKVSVSMASVPLTSLTGLLGPQVVQALCKGTSEVSVVVRLPASSERLAVPVEAPKRWALLWVRRLIGTCGGQGGALLVLQLLLQKGQLEAVT